MAGLKRVSRRVGRRGAILLAFGLVDLIFGGALTRPTPELKAIALYRFADAVAPLPLWGVMWLVVGVVCLVQAFATVDWVGYACAQALKVGWALLALAGWVSGEVPRGYLSTAVWLLSAGILAVCSSWPEPPRLNGGR